MPINWSNSSFADHSVTQIAEVLDKSFEDYIISIKFIPEMVARMFRTQGVDPLESRLLLADGEEAGAAMIARKGDLSRVASLGVYKKFRRMGGARYLMNLVIDEAVQRKDALLELEAVEGNDKAITLYESLGFEKVRRLSGYFGSVLQGIPNNDIKNMDLSEAASMIGFHNVKDAPAMLAGEAYAYSRWPSMGYRYRSAVVVVMPQELDAVELQGMILSPSTIIQSDTVTLLKGLQCIYPGCKWHAGPFFPDELVTPLMLESGYEVMELAQGQYRLDLSSKH
jgi:ribosomal protein S18 acetylase RimI-like enzyme